MLLEQKQHVGFQAPLEPTANSRNNRPIKHPALQDEWEPTAALTLSSPETRLVLSNSKQKPSSSSSSSFSSSVIRVITLTPVPNMWNLMSFHLPFVSSETRCRVRGGFVCWELDTSWRFTDGTKCAITPPPHTHTQTIIHCCNPPDADRSLTVNIHL